MGQFTNPTKREPEGRPNDPPALDSDLRYQFLEDCLAEDYGSVVDRTTDLGPEPLQVLRAWACQVLILDGCGQLRIAGFQCPEPLGQGFDAGPAEILVHLACLEGVEIAVEGFFRFPDLGLDGSQLLLLIRPAGAGPGQVLLDRLLQHLLVLIGVEQRLQHGFVQAARIDALGCAGVATVPLAADRDAYPGRPPDPDLEQPGDGGGGDQDRCLIFARWRQENFFRYMRERHGLDQLLGYASGAADGDRLVANPEWKKVDRELKARRQELTARRAELGQAVLDEPRDSGRTAHGLKIAQKGSVGHLRELEGLIENLLQTRAAMPRQIPLAKAGAREVMLLEQKQNHRSRQDHRLQRRGVAARRPDAALPQPPRRALPAAFLRRLSGEMRTHAGRVFITIDAPDLPLHRRVLRALCQDLNQTAPTFPGTGLPLNYEVAVHLPSRPLDPQFPDI